MQRELVESKVEKRLRSRGKGAIVFAEDFSKIADTASVNKALYRLRQKGVLIRLAQGIYLYPKTDSLLGVLYPTGEEVATAIAKRDRARIIPTGAQALNKLGLSTQVPLNVVYLTDGSARTIHLGNQTIKFKKTTPKNLKVKHEGNGLVIQALREIGQQHLTLSELAKIKSYISNIEYRIIEHDAQLAPAWIRRIMLTAHQN